MQNKKPNRKIAVNDENKNESERLKTIHPKLKKSNTIAKNNNSDRNKLILVPTAVIMAFLASWYYNIWLASLVNTPLNEPKIIDDSSYKSSKNLDRYWGTYRSNLYFGLKTRSNNPLMAGMIWFNQFSRNFDIRHWCDQNDKLVKYGWVAHDGRNFGIHDIYENVENGFSIRSSWVKRHGGKDGGDWTVRTRVAPYTQEEKPSFVSIIFYFATEYTGWIKSVKRESKTNTILSGETEDVGKFKIKVEIIESPDNNQQVLMDQTYGNISVVQIKENLISKGHFIRKKAKLTGLKEYIGFRESSYEDQIEEANFIAFQISGFLPFEFDVIFESDSLREELKEKSLEQPLKLSGKEFDSVLENWHGKFLEKFEEKFKLKEKKFSAPAIAMAQSALSNLIGGIGFFNGQSIVKSHSNKEPVLYWKSNLYSAVPSRSFFPRGFLWDEGFHNILISEWDLDITKDILGHWLDLMNVEGWIPREVILGDEARAKVPIEFWVQNNEYANPPTLFLPLNKVIHRVNDSIVRSNKNIENDPDYVYLSRIFKRLTHWYDWFNKTQVGKLHHTYRWRGRVSDSKTELNPKTLTSGLDDYPRASHPNDQERHLDLRCWMALASKVMGNLYEIVKQNETSSPNPYELHYQTLKNNKILNDLHWSGKQYADYGLHSDRIKLIRQKPNDPNTPPSSMPMIRFVEVEPTNQYVNSVGYVSLFPMLLELINPDSPNLGKVIDQLRDTKELWTKYGLRSLSKNAPLYDKRNTEHDPPYWRSAIWININYLALKSLRFYAQSDSLHRENALKVYEELRKNIIDNILTNYEQTGYIWEQYNDKTGKGQGSHPFTGWSSLVLLIMAEIY